MADQLSPVACFMRELRLQLFDSLKPRTSQPDPAVTRTVLHYFANCARRRNSFLDEARWVVGNGMAAPPVLSPQQFNGSDCGVFVLYTMDRLALRQVRCYQHNYN